MTANDSLQKTANMIKAAYSVGEIASLLRLLAPTQTPGELTQYEFDNLMLKINRKNGRAFTDNSIECARLVMVLGASTVEAAKELGITKQQVTNTIRRIRSLMHSTPNSWRAINLVFPKELHAPLKELQAKLVENHGPDSNYDGCKVELKTKQKDN